jgi:hypothetical protein
MPSSLFDYIPGSFHTMDATPVKGGAGGLLKSPNTGVVPPRLAPVVNLNCMPGPGRRDSRCKYCGKTHAGKTYRCVY